MRPRQIDPGPITPTKDGQPPAWVVACLDCGWSVDAHGLRGQDAIGSVAHDHQHGHKLVAQPIDYTKGWGKDGKSPHPLYGEADHANA